LPTLGKYGIASTPQRRFEVIARINTDRKGKTVARARILLADDHKGMRDRAMRLLEPEFEVVGAVGDGGSLLDEASKTKPDVCVIDISMPVLSGIEAATRLKGSGSAAKIIFLTVHEDPDFVQAALETGALGYVLKSRMASDLCLAVKGAMNGQVFISTS
jgi:DNA-binding NarL/FixJ family response regulator